MPEQPKRRGRPPGSKNAPKTTGSSGTTTITGRREDNYPLPKPAGPAPIKVVLSAKRRGVAFGDPNPDEEIPVDWPAEWRLPQPGDSIHLRNDWGGFVASVDFDIEKGVVRVFLR